MTNRMIHLLSIALLASIVVADVGKLPPETFLDFKGYCAHFGIPVEEHKITTKDNYILTFFRIQSSGSIKQGLKPVYLQHGVIDSADTFIVNYRNEAPALVLADAGYDVWVGNSRGNRYSREHTQHTTKDREFWDFTWSEMADYDLPAAFQYIASVTNQPKIDYVGHSQGTIIMFASLSQKDPIVESLLGKFVALAPVVSMRHQGSTLLGTMSGIAIFADQLRNFGVNEIMQYSDPQAHIQANICHLVPPICAYSFQKSSDLKPELDNMEHIPVVMGHYPAGTSIQNGQHYYQMLKLKEFGLRRFDHGSKGNALNYGSETAPWYDLNNINKKEMYLFSGKYDLLADETDVHDLVKLIRVNNPNVFSKQYEAGHNTFNWGQNQEVMKDLLAALAGQL